MFPRTQIQIYKSTSKPNIRVQVKLHTLIDKRTDKKILTWNKRSCLQQKLANVMLFIINNAKSSNGNTVRPCSEGIIF